mmetsp:Transcript_61634/g.110879  ORF Transcript_61634/g.110879 Transcript_61634/m.110879 type:complete len:272 (+) Transcript_61634:725-1540(+)
MNSRALPTRDPRDHQGQSIGLLQETMPLPLTCGRPSTLHLLPPPHLPWKAPATRKAVAALSETMVVSCSRKLMSETVLGVIRTLHAADLVMTEPAVALCAKPLTVTFEARLKHGAEQQRTELAAISCPEGPAATKTRWRLQWTNPKTRPTSLSWGAPSGDPRLPLLWRLRLLGHLLWPVSGAPEPAPATRNSSQTRQVQAARLQHVSALHHPVWPAKTSTQWLLRRHQKLRWQKSCSFAASVALAKWWRRSHQKLRQRRCLIGALTAAWRC